MELQLVPRVERDASRRVTYLKMTLDVLGKDLLQGTVSIHWSHAESDLVVGQQTRKDACGRQRIHLWGGQDQHRRTPWRLCTRLAQNASSCSTQYLAVCIGILQRA